MKLVIPSVERGQRSYEVPVRRFGSFWMNKVLGVVAFKAPRARKIVCHMIVPGHDSTKARIVKGKPYDGREK